MSCRVRCMDGISCDSSGIGVNSEAPELSNKGILSCAMLDAVQSFASRVYHAFCCCSLLGGQRLSQLLRRCSFKLEIVGVCCVLRNVLCGYRRRAVNGFVLATLLRSKGCATVVMIDGRREPNPIVHAP